MMAAGGAVVQFVSGLDLVRHDLVLWLILLGGLPAGASYVLGERHERAMRLGAAPRSAVPRLVAVSLPLAAAVALVRTVVDLVRG